MNSDNYMVILSSMMMAMIINNLGMRGRRAPFNGMRGKRGPSEEDYEVIFIKTKKTANFHKAKCSSQFSSLDNFFLASLVVVFVGFEIIIVNYSKSNFN